jgi:DNA primase large subunit
MSELKEELAELAAHYAAKRDAVTAKCPCGAPAKAGRFRKQGDPLCMRCYMRNYAADKESKFKRLAREVQVAAKDGKPCADCGVVYPTYVTHWDHVPERGPKLFNIARGDYSMERTLAEIAKCDLVCANCHAVRTWNRRREQGVAPDEEYGLPVAGENGAAAVTAGAVLF